MPLLRVFDVMCWMFSWEGEHGPCGQEMPDQLGKATVPVSADLACPLEAGPALAT